MEDAIVAQVEWYMGRVNLASDAYLKQRMDDDLWVDLDVILDFPKMIRMRVRDKTTLAALLKARSSIVEVDVPKLRIRPAWARRSTLVLHDLPQSTRLEDVLALLHNPHDDSTHAQGLLSVQPAADSIWLAIFESPTGAQNALPLVTDKTVNGVKIRPEVHVETVLAPQAQQNQPDPAAAAVYGRAQSPALPQGQINPAGVYVGPRNVAPGAQEGAATQSAPANAAAMPSVSAAMGYAPMMGPMGMPVPVMHHPSEGMHPQYAYAPPAGYMPPGYAPHNVGVPRQFMGPRGMAGAPANYMMAYPQGGHPFDPATMGVAPQTHGVQPVQQPIDGGSAPGTPATKTGAPEGARGGDMAQGQATSGTGGSPAGVAVVGGENTVAHDERDVGSEHSQEKAGPYPTMAVSEQMSMPIVNAQGMDPSQIMGMQMRDVGKGPVDPHYMHRGAVIGDPNAVGLGPNMAGAGYAPYPRGGGRGQHPHQGGLQRGDRNGQRNSGEGGRGGPRGSGGNSMDSTSRGQPSRKGKKGNRNNSGRHAHGDRHGDGKGEGSASPSHRDDRRPRDEKPKPEPNLNSMDFPPLPMANDSPPSRTGQPSQAAVQSKDVKVTSADAIETADKAVIGGEVNTPGLDRSDGKAEPHDAASLDTNTSAVTEAKASVTESAPGEAGENNLASVSGGVSAVPSEEVNNDSTKAPSDKKAVEMTTSTSRNSNGSTMSYAAILRSKKPAPPRPANPLQRGISDSSTKSGDTNSSGDVTAAPSSHIAKERNPRRRKSNNPRSSQNGDPSKEVEGGSAGSGSSSADKSVNKLPNGPSSSVNTQDQENIMSKVHADAARPNSVWANKPKSLFQARGAVPAARPTVSPSTSEARKAISPVPSQEDDDGRDKTEGQYRMLDVNGQVESASIETQGTAITDASTNGDELPDVNQLSLGKTVVATTGPIDGDVSKLTKGDQVGANGNQTSPKGAWAMGGPKAWPKNNGNGVVERSSSIADS